MKKLMILFLIASISSCMPSKELPTVERVEISKYTGQWYEIARLPNSFEKGLECVTANYSLKENGKIEVLNSGYSLEKEAFKTAKGTAWVPDPVYPGRLKVTFFWPFSGNYYIISLDENYQHVLVGDPSRKYLWVLSRNKELDGAVYSRLLDIASKNDFDVSGVIRVNQNCDN